MVPPVPGGTYRSANRSICRLPLSGGTIDWVCFCLVTSRNRSVTVNFNRRRSLPSGINLAAARKREKKMEKKQEEREREKKREPWTAPL
ncbi:hypothetical protein BHE74_00046369 [Ensete ventricosum]|nr:hypothetical protein GW17_00053713 [Ensete ventricosum]RWW47618.1 hypothetical protein BHE74_00046369 [Ensete ventricosum]